MLKYYGRLEWSLFFYVSGFLHCHCHGHYAVKLVYFEMKV